MPDVPVRRTVQPFGYPSASTEFGPLITTLLPAGNSYVVSGPNASVAVSAGAPIKGSKGQKSVAYNGSSVHTLSLNIGLEASSGFTIFGSFSTSSVSYQAILSLYNINGTLSTAELRVNNDGNFAVLKAQVAQYAVTTGKNYIDGKQHTFAYSQKGDAFICAIDGNTFISGTGSGFSGGVVSSIFVGAQQGTGTDPLTGDIYFIGALRNALPAPALFALSGNPWQLFAPQSRRIWVPSAGGASYTGVISESGTVSDLLTSVAAFQFASSETSTLTDIQAAVAAFQSASSETSTLTDIQAAIAAFQSANDEALIGSDVVDFTGGLSGSIGESLSLSDVVAAIAAFQSANDENLSGSDVNSSVAGFQGADSESLSATDVVNYSGGLADSVNESLTVTDTQAAVAAFQSAISEAETISDLVSALAAFQSAISESSTLSDLQSAIRNVSGASSESITATDTQSFLAGYAGNSTETLSGTDVQSGIRGFQGVSTESGSISDIQAGSWGTSGASSNSLTISDLIGSIGSQTGAITQTATISDLMTAAAAYHKAASESLTATDTSTKALGVTIGELLAAADTQTVTAAAFYAIQAELLSAVDLLTKTGTFAPPAFVTKTLSRQFNQTVLPLAPLNYDPSYINRSFDLLRLYFTKLDKFLGDLANASTSVYLTTDITTNSTTPIATNLTFTPALNTQYIVTGQLILESSNTGTGAQPGVSWPTGLTSGVAKITGTVTATTTASINLPAGTDGNLTATSYPVANTPYPAQIDASFLAGATPAGQFTITICGGGAVNNVTIKAGSWLKYEVL